MDKTSWDGVLGAIREIEVVIDKIRREIAAVRRRLRRLEGKGVSK